MQTQSRQKLLPRFLRFLQSSRGQIFASWCAFGALSCLAIGILLTDYSRLAFPFIIASFLLACLGTASRSHRRIVQVVLALWIIPFNMLGPALFNLGDQASQLSRLQQQVIQLENQQDSLQDQQAALQEQQPLLQSQLKQTQDPDLSDQLSFALGRTRDDVSFLKAIIGYTNFLIGYDTWLVQINDRDLLDNALRNSNQQAMQNDDDQLSFLSQMDVNLHIPENNTLLPAAEQVPFVGRVYQKNCVSGYPCMVQPGWQQPFIDGWQRLGEEPLSTSWFFWLSLLLALPGMFVLLPLTLGPRWVVSYSVRYNGPLSNLNDSTFPEQKRQELPVETSIVKIEVNAPLVPRQKKGQSDALQEFLQINLGPGTTVLDVFLGQRPTEGLAEVAYDKTTGNITLKLKPVAAQLVRQKKGEGQPKRKIAWKEARALNKAMRRLPVHFYVVVDYFAGTIEASTPIADVERLQERRGPAWPGRVAAFCRAAFWWVYALGFYFALMNCSYLFFRTLTTSSQILAWGSGLLVVGLVLKAVEILIMKTTTRPQKTIPLSSFHS